MGGGIVRVGGGSGTAPREVSGTDGEVGTGEELELPCVNPDEFPPEERERVLVILEAAKVAREIMMRPDRDYMEYGSVIFRGSDGRFRHTPISPGSPTGANVDTRGLLLEDMANVYALVHSHVALGYNADYPDARLFPTPDLSQPEGQGDWFALAGWANSASASLTQLGMNADAARQLVEGRLSQFILGATGPAGSDLYGLRGFSFLGDRTAGVVCCEIW